MKTQEEKYNYENKLTKFVPKLKILMKNIRIKYNQKNIRIKYN